jgi:hypothetical protein
MSRKSSGNPVGDDDLTRLLLQDVVDFASNWDTAQAAIS